MHVSFLNFAEIINFWQNFTVTKIDSDLTEIDVHQNLKIIKLKSTMTCQLWTQAAEISEAP